MEEYLVKPFNELALIEKVSVTLPNGKELVIDKKYIYVKE